MRGKLQNKLTRFPWGEYYEDRARRFDDPLVVSEYITPGGKLENELIEAMTDFVIENLAPRPKDLFLEIGCGCGVMISNLLRKGVLGKEVLGIDVAPSMIEKAKELALEADFKVLDAAGVDKLKRRFDRILFWGVLHYLGKHEYVKKSIASAINSFKPSAVALLGWIPDSAMKDEYIKWSRSLRSVARKLRTPRKDALEWLWFDKEYFKALEQEYPVGVEILEHRQMPGELNRFFFSVRVGKLI